jgi:hypothetical protein
VVRIGHEQALRRERILLRDETHDHGAVRLDRAAQIVFDEFARQLQTGRVDRFHTRWRHHRPMEPRVHDHGQHQHDQRADEDRPATLSA